jgi:hypothetical protein
MTDGVISTVACGVAAAFDVFANPAQPLSTAAPHASIANIAAVPQTRRLLAPDPSALFVVLALAIASPPALRTERQTTASTRVKNTG